MKIQLATKCKAKVFLTGESFYNSPTSLQAHIQFNNSMREK